MNEKNTEIIEIRMNENIVRERAGERSVIGFRQFLWDVIDQFEISAGKAFPDALIDALPAWRSGAEPDKELLIVDGYDLDNMEKQKVDRSVLTILGYDAIARCLDAE